MIVPEHDMNNNIINENDYNLNCVCDNCVSLHFQMHNKSVFLYEINIICNVLVQKE